MRRWRILRRMGGGTATGLLLLSAAACGRAPDSFAPVTDRGRTISHLFVLVMVLSALVFLLVAGLLLYVLVRYRARPGADEPEQVEGSRRLEIAWTVAPALLLTALFVLTLKTMITVTSSAEGALRVKVIGRQWWWEYQYPDLGVVTANELHVPTGTPLRLEIEGGDVIHSFWVPQFGWKQDAVPGKTNVMAMQVDRAGVYDGACTEYCGLQHAWMRIRVVVEPRDRFDAWANAQRQPAAAPQAGTAVRGQQLFLSNTCVSCHTVAGTAADGRVGPDLSHFGSRATIGAGVIDNTPQNLGRWIRHAGAVKPGVLMPPFSFSDAEVQALVDYLEGLR